jgi:tRNA-dihydrouridine synthase
VRVVSYRYGLTGVRFDQIWEFTSADGLYRMRESKRKRYLHFYDDERPIAAQLFGSDPVTLAGSARQPIVIQMVSTAALDPAASDSRE